MQTYLFYDIETTGLNKAFDQVLQFAAIRTNSNLEEIERYEYLIKLNCDVIPSPGAMLIHQLPLKKILQGQTEYEAIREIHKLLNQPGTISLGYNSLGFDDEFLRFSFYRNLLSPYTHQYANACGRMDLYPMSVMFYLFKNDVIDWPTTLKLEHLNLANNFFNGQSHHAMVDVEITLALARKFFQASKMWQYLSGFFNKQIDQARTQSLTFGLLIEGALGAEQYYQCPALFLGYHQRYKNQQLWLRLDQDRLRETTIDTLKETTFVFRKKLGEPSFILPWKPRFINRLTPERLNSMEVNKQWLNENPTLLESIITYHSNYIYPLFPETDSEASLYLNGFLTTPDAKICHRFHTAPIQHKRHIYATIDNLTLKELALRILGRHYPDVLHADEKQAFDNYLDKVIKTSIIDHQGRKRLSPQTALDEMNQLLTSSDLSSHKQAILHELAQYLENTFRINPN